MQQASKQEEQAGRGDEARTAKGQAPSADRSTPSTTDANGEPSWLPALIEVGHAEAPSSPKSIDTSPAARVRAPTCTDGTEKSGTTPDLDPPVRRRLGERLVRAGLVTIKQLELALAEQRATRRRIPLGHLLVEKGWISEEQLYRTLAEQYHLPFFDLGQVQINRQALDLVSPELMREHRVLPFDVDGATLLVATCDPTALHVQDLLRFHAEKKIAEVLVTPSQLRLALKEHLGIKLADEYGVDDLLNELAEQSVADAVVEDSDEDLDEASETDSAVVRLVNQIIAEAYRRGASDIHLEPQGSRLPMQVRLRIDGDCILYQEIPPAFWRAVVSRIKVMADLDISERRRPQDGKIRLTVGDERVELRVATLPTVNENEDVVLRVLSSSTPLPVHDLGLQPDNLSAFLQAVQQPYGLFLCVGPTGSGKTTTLHSALALINSSEKKIWTVEDPVEITQAGLRQVQVQRKAGVTFESVLRAFLRADPDVIMVGEMRDRETAQVGVEASMTGHLVFSTLHTNTAPDTIARLLSMGLSPCNLADALVCVLAQRLTRTLCSRCREPRQATSKELERMTRAFGGIDNLVRATGAGRPETISLWHARGCDHCSPSGYRGRVALHELLFVDDEIRAAVQRQAGAIEIRRVALERGMTTLLQDGIRKAIRGETELKRVLSVCSR